VVVGLVVKLTGEYKSKIKLKKNRTPVMPQLAEEIPLGFFDGASQGQPPICGAVAFLFLSKSHFFRIRYVPGLGTNNKAELAALWAMLLRADMLHLRKLQVFGDSQVVVDWINSVSACQIRRPRPLMRQVRDFIDNLEWFSCKHIFRELNEKADKLSKVALSLDVGAFILQDFFEDPFIKEVKDFKECQILFCGFCLRLTC
jgi:ribonuclease HI